MNGSVGSAMQRCGFGKDGSIGFGLLYSCEYLLLIFSVVVLCLYVCVKKKKKLGINFNSCFMVTNFFSFVHYITLFDLDLLFFHIGSMGMMRFYCQLFSFLLMFSL